MATKIVDLDLGMKVSGTVHDCERCGVRFIARADARFCSNACRVSASRGQSGETKMTYRLADHGRTKTIYEANGVKPVAWVTKSHGHGWDVRCAESGKTVHIPFMPKSRDADEIVAALSE